MSVDAQPPPTPTAPASGEPSTGSVILKPVFIPAAAVIVGLIGLVLLFREQAEDLTAVLNSAITDGVGRYVIAVNFFLVFVLLCAFTRIGRIRLGRDDERPEFGVVSWFMMLFSAGMGIGLSARLRGEVRGLPGMSTSLGGFEPDQRPGGDAAEAAIVSYRPLSSGNLEFDADSGRPIGTQTSEDPLAGGVLRHGGDRGLPAVQGHGGGSPRERGRSSGIGVQRSVSGYGDRLLSPVT